MKLYGHKTYALIEDPKEALNVITKIYFKEKDIPSKCTKDFLDYIFDLMSKKKIKMIDPFFCKDIVTQYSKDNICFCFSSELSEEEGDRLRDDLECFILKTNEKNSYRLVVSLFRHTNHSGRY